MRTAVVVMAYLGNPAGVAQLSTYFESMDAHLYVHVDAKVDQGPYETLSNRPNLTLLKSRQQIFWGGFNTVRAVIGAIEVAQQSSAYGRFVIITEDSIPLVNLHTMAEMLASDVEWIEIDVSEQDWVWQRYREYYCYDGYPTNPRYFDPRERSFDASFLKKLERLQNLMIEGKTPLNTLCIGSSWWALSASAIKLVLDRHREDRRLRESFEFSAIPEEHYFQTILEQARLDRPKSPLMHTDFERSPKPYVYRDVTEVLDVQRANHRRPFLRKVDLQNAGITDFVHRMARE